MTEEQKPPVKPVTGGVPMEYYFRLETLDNRSFVGECRKIAKEKSVESLSATVALVLLGANARGNDPYMLDSHSRKKGVGFNLQRGSEKKKEEEKK